MKSVKHNKAATTYKWWLIICAGMAIGLSVYFSSPSSEASTRSLGAGFKNQGAGVSSHSSHNFSCPDHIKVGCQHNFCPQRFNAADLEIIRRAAERNNCTGDNLSLLFAIRRAENGSPGNEFGVKGVRGLDKQAGWAAASIIKSRRRWNTANRPTDFITFLGNRYCPPDDHPLNKHWVKNVKFWFERYRKCQQQIN